MLVKDLPKDTKLKNVKVRVPIPIDLIEGETELFLFNIIWGIVFFTLDPPDQEIVQLFEAPTVRPSDILDWEVVENRNI